MFFKKVFTVILSKAKDPCLEQRFLASLEMTKRIERVNFDNSQTIIGYPVPDPPRGVAVQGKHDESVAGTIGLQNGEALFSALVVRN